MYTFPITVSIQGEKGSFHHTCGTRVFSQARYLERSTFREVFDDVAQKLADVGIVAIENSIAGSLSYNYDALAKYKIPIIGGYYLRISHFLIGTSKASLTDVKTVWSHPMAIEQCRVFLESNSFSIEEKRDTAGSVQEIVALKDPSKAAIASSSAAEIYGGRVLAGPIETDPKNYTRFLFISSKPIQLKGMAARPLKTSLVLRLKSEPGALLNVLELFAKARLNLTKIESRPIIGSPWHYDFYMDFDGDITQPKEAAIVEMLRQRCAFLQILGCYPTLGDDFNA